MYTEKCSVNKKILLWFRLHPSSKSFRPSVIRAQAVNFLVFSVQFVSFYPRELFLSEVNNRETIVTIDANNDTYYLQNWIEKFPLTHWKNDCQTLAHEIKNILNGLSHLFCLKLPQTKQRLYSDLGQHWKHNQIWKFLCSLFSSNASWFRIDWLRNVGLWGCSFVGANLAKWSKQQLWTKLNSVKNWHLSNKDSDKFCQFLTD